MRVHENVPSKGLCLLGRCDKGLLYLQTRWVLKYFGGIWGQARAEKGFGTSWSALVINRTAGKSSAQRFWRANRCAELPKSHFGDKKVVINTGKKSLKWRAEETIHLLGKILIWLRGQKENTAPSLIQTNAIWIKCKFLSGKKHVWLCGSLQQIARQYQEFYLGFWFCF